MSRNGSVTLTFGDGEHLFRLALGELRELQEKCDAGPQEIARRLQGGTWRIDDVREPIRLGLIGGGMKPADAYVTVKRYVDERPAWAENALVAFSVLAAAIVGVEEEPLGKARAGKRKPRSQKASGDTPASTATEP
jgi:hypothetical protein